VRRICAVVTSRPSYSRIQTALRSIADHPDLELQLVIAASALLDRYGNVSEYIEQDGFEIAERVFSVVEGSTPLTMTKTTGLGVIEMATVLERLEPDATLVVADRFEIISAAIAASYMNIPLVHVQGGEVTGSIDEKVRHAVTKLANVHFPSTRHAAERIVRLGEDPSSVYMTGCPSIDIARRVLDHPELHADVFEQYGGVGPLLDISAGFLVVLQHPVTTEFTDARRHVWETLEAMAELGRPTLWFWPNVDAGSDGTSEGIRAFRELRRPDNIHFFKNLRPDDFLRLLLASDGIVGNSSVAIRECAYLGVPAVNIGSRQAGRDRGSNVIDVGYDRDDIATAVRKQIAHGPYASDHIYGEGDAGTRIAAHLADIPLPVEKRLAY
jgi:UDP-hydrolysing UDP-N-acetyl-D-glucosamine 2-epimerase